MRVEKIDIKRKTMDIPRGRNRMVFAEMPPLSVAMFGDGESPPNNYINITRKEYFVQRFYDGKRTINYLIQLDDRGLYNDCIQISNDRLAQVVYEKTSYYRKIISHTAYMQRQKIKKLPWWKRLLNKF